MVIERRDETNVCEVIAVITQRIKELEDEWAATSMQELDRAGLTARIYELHDLCERLGWAKYLPMRSET